MTERAVYDTMVFYQWAVLPKGRQHGTLGAVTSGKIRLCLSTDILDEIADLLSRPNIRAKSKHLTTRRISQFLKHVEQLGSIFDAIPHSFTWPQHLDDDHLFNLAIHTQAKYLVTWESRLLNLPGSSSAAAKRLKELAPRLSIVTPKQLVQILQIPRGEK